MVFDDWRNGIHVAFFAISRTQEYDLIPVLRSLHHRITTRRENRCPSSIIVDNAQAEINTLRYLLVFFICWLCFSSTSFMRLGFLLFLARAGLCGQTLRSSYVFGMFGRFGQRMLLKKYPRSENVLRFYRWLRISCMERGLTLTMT